VCVCVCVCVCVSPTLTYVVQVQCQVFVLEQVVVGQAGPLDLLEEGADVPAVQDIQQHDAGNTQAHIEHRLDAVLHCHGLSLTSDRQAEVTTNSGCTAEKRDNAQQYVKRDESESGSRNTR